MAGQGCFGLRTLWQFLLGSRSFRGCQGCFAKQQLNHLFTASFFGLLLCVVLVCVRPEGRSWAVASQAPRLPRFEGGYQRRRKPRGWVTSIPKKALMGPCRRAQDSYRGRFGCGGAVAALHEGSQEEARSLSPGR